MNPSLRYLALASVALLRPPALDRDVPPAVTVPRTVRVALAARGCRVPGRAREGTRPAIVRAQLGADSALRWAVECGHAILVVRLQPRIQVDSAGAVGDGLFVASPARVRQAIRDYGESSDTAGLGPIRHAGLLVPVAECCSVIYYWDGRRWRELTAAD